MGFLILAAFVIVPIVEIALLLQVGSFIGIPATIALVVLTAVLGTFLLRAQGLEVLRKANAALTKGQEPVEAIRDGVCILLAGALLLTPGFVTDTVGLLLFVPWVRVWLGRRITTWLAKRMHIATFSPARAPEGKKAWGPPPGHGSSRGRSNADNARPSTGSTSPGKVIDGEFRDVTPTSGPEAKGSSQTHRTTPAARSPWSTGDGEQP